MYSNNPLYSGIVKILAIIAVLQLVKKIPDIINSVFGIKIQTKGGIKGRLGEMAGIGGMAQKAWTSLGTGAKNLAKLGVALPAVAGFAAGNALYKKKYGKDLLDTKAGRIIRGAGSGVSSALKTGSWLKARDAAVESYDKTSASPVDKAKYVKMVNEQVNNDLADENGNSVVNEMNIDNKVKARDTIDKRIQQKYGKNVADSNRKVQQKTQSLSLAKSIAADNDAVNTLLTNAMGAYSEGSSERTKILEALNTYEKEGGKKGIENLRYFLTDNSELFDSATWDNLVGKNGKLTAKERKLNYAITHQEELGLTDNNMINLQGGKSAVQFLADKTLQGSFDEAKADYDIAVAGARLSDLEKMELDKNASAMSDINNSMAFAIGRTFKDNGYAPSVDATWIPKPPEYSEPTTTSTTAPTPAPSSETESTSGGRSTYSSYSDEQGLFESSGANNPENNGENKRASRNYWRKATTGSAYNKNQKPDDTGDKK